MIKKNIEDKLKKWHETLNDVLWAMSKSRSTATGITHFQLTYEHGVFLLVEINSFSLRVAKLHLLYMDDYQQAMLMELDSTDDDMLAALSKIELSKQKMAKVYDVSPHA